MFPAVEIGESDRASCHRTDGVKLAGGARRQTGASKGNSSIKVALVGHGERYGAEPPAVTV